MFKHFALRGLRMLGLSVIAGVAICVPTRSSAAQHFAGGYHGGGFGGHPGYAVRGGYGYGRGGGYHGYYGRGYYGGYRGWGYGGWGYGSCCWWGWPTGLFLATLPLYYSTWWWNGVPYYYADDNYYIWDGSSSRYEQVAPPNGLLSNGTPSPPAAGNAAAMELFAYPKNGQNAEQQARDRRECRDWAASQSGTSAAGAIAAATPQSTDANVRAQTACLEARGYSVK